MRSDISSLEFYYSSILPQPRYKPVNILFRIDFFLFNLFQSESSFLFTEIMLV